MSVEELSEEDCKVLMEAALGLAVLRRDNPNAEYEVFFSQDCKHYIIVELPRTTEVGYA
jgi:hypothetical protein